MKSILVIAMLAALSASAQDASEYPAWMKTIGGNMAATKKALDAKSHEAANSATVIAQTFDKVHGFWRAKGAADAQGFAATAKSSAEEIARHAHANEFDKAAEAFSRLGGTCKGCHDAHREKAADGSWKIK